MRLAHALLVPALACAVLAGAPAGPAAADDAAQSAPADVRPRPPRRGRPGRCPGPGAAIPAAAASTPGQPEDATPVPFQTGDVFEVDRLTALENYLPAFIWQERDRFFYEGMRLEIGPCFADYAPPAFFQAATEQGAGKARLDGEGGLVDYGAGLPFAPVGHRDGRPAGRASSGSGTCSSATRARASAGASGSPTSSAASGAPSRSPATCSRSSSRTARTWRRPRTSCQERARQRVGGGRALRDALRRARVRVAAVPERREPDVGAALRRSARLPAAVAARAAHERERRSRGSTCRASPSASCRTRAPDRRRRGDGGRRRRRAPRSAATAVHDPDQAQRLRGARVPARTSTSRRSSASTTCSRRSTCAIRCGRRRRTATSALGPLLRERPLGLPARARDRGDACATPPTRARTRAR